MALSTDWDSLKEAEDELLINSLSMLCPFDPEEKQALLEALEGYPGTIVLVSHDTDFVAELSPDRALMMPEGDVHFFDESMLDLVALA